MDHRPGNLAYRAYQLIWEALDWLYPPECGGCGKPGTRWCGACLLNTVEVSPPFCSVCGNPTLVEGVCQRCQLVRPHFTALRSHTVFTGPVRQAIHRLKYRRDLGLGEALSRSMITSVRKLNWSLDIITSVPLGLARLRERGYNQATLLARPIALGLGLPFLPRLLIRTRETRTQVGLAVDERQANMVDAFRLNNQSVIGKNILVVDDVATSGATMNACAKALIDGGATNIYGFSLARAIFTPDNQIDLS